MGLFPSYNSGLSVLVMKVKVLIRKYVCIFCTAEVNNCEKVNLPKLKKFSLSVKHSLKVRHCKNKCSFIELVCDDVPLVVEATVSRKS